MAYIAPRRPPADVVRAHTAGNGLPADPTQPSSLPTSRDRTRTGLPERQSKSRLACLSVGAPEAPNSQRKKPSEQWARQRTWSTRSRSARFLALPSRSLPVARQHWHPHAALLRKLL